MSINLFPLLEHDAPLGLKDKFTKVRCDSVICVYKIYSNDPQRLCLNSFVAQVEPLQVQLKAQPLAWKPPWRIPVNSTLGLEALAEPAGYASQLKAVEDEETAPSGQEAENATTEKMPKVDEHI